MKILICYKNTKVNDPNACHVGMGVTASNNANYLVRTIINTIVVSVNDGYHLKSLLAHPDYKDITHVVMSAPFFDTAFLKTLCNTFPKKQFTITFHSNAGFLGLDKWAMKMLGELIEVEKELPNFKISVNSEKFARVVNGIYDINVLTLPNLYPIQLTIPKRKLFTTKKPTLKVGCFSAIRSLKNIPTAAFATAILAKKLQMDTEFHIVVGREEDPQAEKIITGIENLFSKLPNIRLVKNDWSVNDEFKTLVKKMDILIQPSFSESFNNVTADAITNSVPVVVSEAIDWLPEKFRANSDDAQDIANVAIRLLKDTYVIEDAYYALSDHNKKTLKYWKEYIFGKKPESFWNRFKRIVKGIFVNKYL